jgi:hypothetical protein
MAQKAHSTNTPGAHNKKAADDTTNPKTVYLTVSAICMSFAFISTVERMIADEPTF